MSHALVWTLLTLASYRLWRLLALDDLPGVAEARAAATVRLPDRYGEAIYCPWCLGFWTSVAVFVAADLAGTSIPLPAAQIAAASTVVGLIGARLDG